jgi:hypothetical protein
MENRDYYPIVFPHAAGARGYGHWHGDPRGGRTGAGGTVLGGGKMVSICLVAMGSKVFRSPVRYPT